MLALLAMSKSILNYYKLKSYCWIGRKLHVDLCSMQWTISRHSIGTHIGTQMSMAAEVGVFLVLPLHWTRHDDFVIASVKNG